MFWHHARLHCWTIDPRNAALKNSDVHNVASWHVHRQTSMALRFENQRGGKVVATRMPSMTDLSGYLLESLRGERTSSRKRSPTGKIVLAADPAAAAATWAQHL